MSNETSPPANNAPVPPPAAPPGNPPPAAPPPATTPPAAPPGNPPPVAPPPSSGAPDKYDLKGADGVKFEGPAFDAFSTLAKEQKLNNADAQKIADVHFGVIGRMNADAQTKLDAFFADIGGKPDTWENASKTDKEFGGDNFPQNQAAANRVLATFDRNGEAAAVLKKTGYGNHPAILGLLFRASKAISEDRFVSGTTRPTPPAAAMTYDKSGMNP